MKCKNCGGPTIPLATSRVCKAECDKRDSAAPEINKLVDAFAHQGLSWNARTDRVQTAGNPLCPHADAVLLLHTGTPGWHRTARCDCGASYEWHGAILGFEPTWVHRAVRWGRRIEC